MRTVTQKGLKTILIHKKMKIVPGRMMGDSRPPPIFSRISFMLYCFYNKI